MWPKLGYKHYTWPCTKAFKSTQEKKKMVKNIKVMKMGNASSFQVVNFLYFTFTGEEGVSSVHITQHTHTRVSFFLLQHCCFDACFFLIFLLLFPYFYFPPKKQNMQFPNLKIVVFQITQPYTLFSSRFMRETLRIVVWLFFVFFFALFCFFFWRGKCKDHACELWK